MQNADTFNEEHAPAYALSDEAALAQLACTGMLQPVYYATPTLQLRQLLRLGSRVDPEFLAKTASYARQSALLKETPALLCALLAQRDGKRLREIFHHVIDTGPMLRKFVGYLREGAVGRRSLGRRPRELVHEWFERRTDEQLLWASVGNAPSLADVIRLAHVRPGAPEREALFGHLLGNRVAEEALPDCARNLRRFQRTGEGPVPDVPFQLLTGVPLDGRVWTQIARQASWNRTRMNLNTFARHGVFTDREIRGVIAERLANPELVRRANVLPYQLLTCRNHLDPAVPDRVRRALSRALDLTLDHVPALPGATWVCVDVSGSMAAPLSPQGRTRCVDVAALFAAALLRKNPDARLIAFDHSAHELSVDPRWSVDRLASHVTCRLGGGTDCAAPLRLLRERGHRADLVVLVSDQESWLDSRARATGPRTPLSREWELLRSRNPEARMVCLDLQPYTSVQLAPSWETLHVGGFSDEVFHVLERFVSGRLGPEAWTRQIREHTLQPRHAPFVQPGMRS